METKVGVYVCKGCEIAKSLDVEKLVKLATGEGKVPVCKAHGVLCSQEGVAMIRQDIAEQGDRKSVV